MTIRRATKDDLAGIIAIYAADSLRGARESEAKADMGRYASAFMEIDADPRQLLLVAEDTGRVVGTLQITALRHLIAQGFKRAIIEAIFVLPDQRGRGIGTRLIEAANAWAHAQGCASLELTSNKQRSRAHAFYARLGFSATHEGFKRPVRSLTGPRV